MKQHGEKEKGKTGKWSGGILETIPEMEFRFFKFEIFEAIAKKIFFF